MRIGLFTDTYRPTINGITFVVESLKNNLEAMGHEVYVFCPARTMSLSKRLVLTAEDDHIIRFPSFPSGLFTDFDFTLFFPPRIMHQIEEMELDVIHIFTPSQVGLLGINAAIKNNTPFITQHSTDLYQFVENYPNVLPGILALVGIVFPMSVKLKGKDIREIIKLYRPRTKIMKWNQDIVAKAMTMLYSKADAVIVLSRKSERQLKSWQDKHYRYDLTLMPNGVNAIPHPSEAALRAFRTTWGLSKKDEVFGFVGRLGEEKNLPILIKAFDRVGKARPAAKLLFVGDFEYRKTLEAMAAASKYPDRIIFTGSIPREQLGVAYEVMDVFTFPSLKDTQGWVLHEAAQAHRPIVLIDTEVSEVVHDGENGYYAKNQPTDFANKVTALLSSPAKRRKFGERSKQLAMAYTEKKQMKKLEKLYHDVILDHAEKILAERHNSVLSRGKRLLKKPLRMFMTK